MMEEFDTKEVYCNAKQLDFLEAKQKIKVALCGRGFGKSYLIGEQLIDLVKGLVGGKFALVGMTFTHIQTKTLPAIKSSWRNWGLSEYDEKTGEGDFVSFKKPPRSWVKNMISPPDDFKRVISFPNGSHIELVSWSDVDKARGSSFDAMLIDEAAWLDEEDFNQALSPTLRGNIYRFEGNHLHQCLCLFTSMPWLSAGRWIFVFEELAKVKPDKYFWLEASAQDNVDALGSDWIQKQKEILPEAVFRIEIMNERDAETPNAFYYAFNERLHAIDERSYLQYLKSNNLNGEVIDLIHTSIQSKDYVSHWEITNTYGVQDYCINPNAPLDISFDFNATFNSCIVGQLNPQTNTYVVFEEFFVKKGSFINNVETFCDVFKYHNQKTINVYGDRNGNKRDASNTLTFFEQILNKFKKKGWVAHLHSVGGVEQLHNLRHYVSNKILEETTQAPRIRFMPNVKFTPISIKHTPTKDGYKKDKSSEAKNQDNRETATDLSDCFDYLVYDKFAKMLGQNLAEQMPMQII